MPFLRSKNLPIIEIAIAIIVIILPFFNSSRLINGIQTAKSFNFFYFILALACLASLALLFKKEKIKLNITPIDIFFFAFVAWVSLNKYLLHEVHSFSLRYFELLGLCIFYIILRTIGQKFYTLILVAICISGFAQALYGNLQLWGYYSSYHGLFKMTGSFFNPGPYAGFLCCVLPVAVGLYWNRQNCKLVLGFKRPFRLNNLKLGNSNLILFIIKYLSLFTILAILLVLPAARSRAAWLGAIAGVSYLAWFKYRMNHFFNLHSHHTLKLFNKCLTIRSRTIVVIFALVLFAGSFCLYHYKKDSADGRMLIWTVTANIIKDNQLLGVGQDRFKAYSMNYQSDYFLNHPNSKYGMVADDNQYVFNEFLNIWAENGVVGLLLIVGLIVIVFFKRERVNGLNVPWVECSVQQSNSEVSNIQTLKHSNGIAPNRENLEPETLLRSSLLAVLVFSLFAYPSEILSIKIIATICVGLLASMTVPLLTRDEFPFLSMVKDPLRLLLLKLSFVSVIIAAILVVTLQVNKCFIAYCKWKDAIDLYNYGLYKQCLDDFEKAYPVLKYNGEYLLNYGKALSMAEQHNEAVALLEQTKSYQSNSVLYTALGYSYKALEKFESAEQQYLHAAHMSPVKFYPLYLLAKLYDTSGQQQKALEMANIILNKKVKVHSTAIDEIEEEMQQIIEQYRKGKQP